MQKTGRIEEDIKYYLSKIMLEKVKNPKIDGVVTVTAITVTKDLRYATVFVSIFGSKSQKKVFGEIQKAKGYIKRELGMMLRARSIPDLVFKMDDSAEYGSHMDRVLKELDINKNEENVEDFEGNEDN